MKILNAAFVAIGLLLAYNTPSHAVTVEDAPIASTQLPKSVEETVQAVAEHHLHPVVIVGEDALGKFNEMLVLAYGEQAKLPANVGYLVGVDWRGGEIKEQMQTVMAFDKTGKFVGAGKVDVAFMIAALNQFDRMHEGKDGQKMEKSQGHLPVQTPSDSGI